VPRVLVLNEHEVEELLDPAGCLEAMAQALSSLARGEVFVPLRPIVRPPDEESMLGLMPVHRAGERPLYGLKTVAVVPDNPTRGLDPHQGTVTLFDGETGQTIAVLNATPITAIRTAACSALATRTLAREDARVLAIVGAGHQARAHVPALLGVRDFEEVRVCGRTAESGRTLEALDERVRGVESAEQAVRGADVVVTVTNSAEPVLCREWLKEGAHVNAAGACFPHMRELDSATVADSAFFVDRRESCEHEAGDYLIPLAEGAIDAGHIRAELGEVLVADAAGRGSAQELTVFESLGIAVEDLFAAEYLVGRAREAGAGTSLEF
jgi:ornithine cyclodeaminase/alanine dehydrogenase-like protein (mu-crystallin family)